MREFWFHLYLPMENKPHKSIFVHAEDLASAYDKAREQYPAFRIYAVREKDVFEEKPKSSAS